MDGSDGTRRTRKKLRCLYKIEEAMRAIRALSIVTKLSPVAARNSHGHDIGFP
jgi:hypothetical protein